jgi:molybdopterin-guanine dinucleotide biosynthesis protein A
MNRQPNFLMQPIVLAGGKSSRMGQNKSFVLLGGMPLIEAVLGKIRSMFSLPPLLVTNSPELYSYLGLTMIGDVIQGKGPLGGIHTGLTHSQITYNFIFACDMPFIQANFVQYMMESFQGEDVLMPCYNGVQPLHAIYAKGCLPFIEEALQQDKRKIIDFLPQVRTRYLDTAEILKIPAAEQSFININNPQELERARSL